MLNASSFHILLCFLSLWPGCVCSVCSKSNEKECKLISRLGAAIKNYKVSLDGLHFTIIFFFHPDAGVSVDCWIYL